MPVPTLIGDLSQTAASNYPAGSDSPAILDDVQRAHASFIAQLRDGAHVPSATGKTTPVDADLIPINDSAASNIIKKLTWANLKATLKTYFDTLYAATGAFAASGANSDITSLSALTNGIVGTSGNQTIGGTKTFSSQPVLPQAPVLGTVTSAVGASSVDFTGIPSWVTRITAIFDGISTNGTDVIAFRLGAGSVATSGYTAQAWSGAVSGGPASNGFYIAGSNDPAYSYTGRIEFSHIGANVWVATGILNIDDASNVGYQMSGRISLGGVLDRVRLTTTSGGGNTFDEGSVNILYE